MNFFRSCTSEFVGTGSSIAEPRKCRVFSLHNSRLSENCQRCSESTPSKLGISKIMHPTRATYGYMGYSSPSFNVECGGKKQRVVPTLLPQGLYIHSRPSGSLLLSLR